MRHLRLFVTAGFLAVLVFALAPRLTPTAHAADQEWGTIKGQVIFNGDKVPEQAPPKTLADAMDKQKCIAAAKAAGKDVLTESWVVNPKNKGTKWVIVWLVDAKDPNAKIPVHPLLALPAQQVVTMDQPCCMFEPHIICLRAGQQLEAKNSADLAHNYKIDGPQVNPNLNQLVPSKKSVMVGPWVAHPIPSQVSCTIHGWMRAYVRVFDHPYFAVTDENGNFVIKNAPAGDYRIVMWHEETGYFLGEKDKKGVPVTIKAKAETDLGQFKLTPEK